MEMNINQKLNIQRALVMSANDGIISIAGVVFGVFGATVSNWAILIAGLSATIAGTFSMSLGEYVSVKAQLSSEQAAKHEQERALADDFDSEKRFLIQRYINKGVEESRATALANQVMSHDAVKPTLRFRKGIDANNLISPKHAALASLLAFPLGSLIPLLGMTLLPDAYRVVASITFVMLALIFTGFFTAKYGDAPKSRVILRNVIAGLITMTVTFGVGQLIGM
jgi:VIT1/CCC1 family predicted Fe2+/Mn2+ transporter